jgi:hypothetical protein
MVLGDPRAQVLLENFVFQLPDGSDATTAVSVGSLLYYQCVPFAILKPKNRNTLKGRRRGLFYKKMRGNTAGKPATVTAARASIQGPALERHKQLQTPISREFRVGNA